MQASVFAFTQIECVNTDQTIFMLNSAEHEIFFAAKYEMPTIVGIFIFISREIFMLGSV